MRLAGGVLILMLLSFMAEYEVWMSSYQRNAYAPSISASDNISTPEELSRKAYDIAIASSKQNETPIEIVKNISLFQLLLMFILAIIFINTGNEINEIKTRLSIK